MNCISLFRHVLPLLALTLATTTPSMAQTLLPTPRSVSWQRGTFSTDRPLRMVNTDTITAAMAAEGGFAVANATQTVIVSGNTAAGYFIFRSLPSDSNPEAYTLTVGRDTVVVAAATTAGFRYAKATLLQLAKGKHGLACCHIEDAPAMAWRGAMIDVSRHFMPLDFLFRQVDAMAAYKLNRLHLHLTDAAGWRMEIKAYPRLTQFGAWRTEALWKTWWNGDRHYAEEGSAEANGGYYTQEQLRSLVAYAATRGITVVPEIEMPAHSEEVLTAYPELSCTHEPYRQADFCPGNEQTYRFLEQVLTEVMAVFPSTDIHIGGDEAGKASWGNCPLCRQRMATEGYRDVAELQGYLVRRIGGFLQQHGRRLVAWDEVLADSLPPSATVMVWRDTACVREAIARGHKVILSPGKYYYLDAYQDAPPTLPEAMGGYLPLVSVYDYAPLAALTPSERQYVRGVQGNLWTEYVPTPSDAERQLWPRLLAVAETGWCGDAAKDYANFRQRALTETKRLRSTGIAAFDLSQEVGERKEAQTLVKHKGRGAKVIYTAPYYEKYSAAGDAALTDGQRGGWDYGTGSAWQGFISRPRLDVTIDLGHSMKLHRIATNFFQSTGPEIFLPSRYIVSVSENSKDFTTLLDCRERVERFVTPNVYTWEWQGHSRARYVRVQAQSGEYGGWIFADEIEIY